MKLAARGLSIRLGSRRVLDGVDLSLDGGEFVLLAGRNGAGKSTMLRLLLGALRPDAGELLCDDAPLASWSHRERARRIAYVPQDADCPFEFTGRELVAMGRHAHRGRLEPERAVDREAVDAALNQVGAQGFADRSVTTLSGGELRLIAVARALATEAPLLLLDEPTSNLDLEHALHLAALLRQLTDAGRGVLVSTHDLNLVAPFAHRVALLHGGRIHADGAPETALAADNVAAVFGVAAVAPSGYFPRSFRSL